MTKLSDTQLRLLRRFKIDPHRIRGFHDVCIHECGNRGGRFSDATFQALFDRGLIEPSLPINIRHQITWWKITNRGIDHLKQMRGKR